MKNLKLFLACIFCTLFSTKVIGQTVPEPCTSNPIFSDTIFHLPIMMNEILPEGLNGESWVEFYNCRPYPINFSGWFLTNDPMDSLKKRIDSFMISSGEFKVLQLPFIVSRSFGLLQLWRPDSTMAYGMTFDGVKVGESVGFCGNMITRQIPSPGYENNCSVLGINEVQLYSDEEVRYYDFIGKQIEKPLNGLCISVKNGSRKKIFITQ